MPPAYASAAPRPLRIGCERRSSRCRGCRADMSERPPDKAADESVRCDACPVICFIKPGRVGACDRYANRHGELVRVDPHVILNRTLAQGGAVVPFDKAVDWDGEIL